MRNERESDVERKKEYAMKGDLTRGFWGLVEGGVSMWGLKGVAWQPPPALRNGRHTRHTHTPPSSFVVSFSLPSFLHRSRPSSSCSSSHRVGGCTLHPPPAHNTYPAPYTSRVRGKFLNFARIENFHILFPRRRGAVRAASCSSQSSPSSFSSCDSCNRTEKFPKAIPFHPAFSRIVSRAETTSATRNLGFQRIK